MTSVEIVVTAEALVTTIFAPKAQSLV
jgi:hypothetical protein